MTDEYWSPTISISNFSVTNSSKKKKQKKTCVFRSEAVIKCSVRAFNRPKLLWSCFWVFSQIVSYQLNVIHVCILIVITLIVRTSEYQQCNINLQKRRFDDGAPVMLSDD